MQYDTVVFDLDGTLLNTLEDLKDATNYALRTNGYPQRTLEEVRRFVGNGVRKLLERALPEDVSQESFAQVFADFKEYYGKHCEDTTCAYDGIMDMMAQLKEAGYRIAIVSNKLDSAVKELSRTYFQDYVQAAIGEKEGVRRKPAPDMVQTALEELGSKAEAAVYIGDSEVDIQTAANVGLDCISVTWGFREAAFLKEQGAKRMVDTPQQLFTLLQTL